MAGGQSIFGESQTRRTDGGGRWFCEVGPILLSRRAEIQTYEALLLDWNNGNDKVVVHRHAGKLSAAPDGQSLVPFSDGTTFSDGSPLVSGQVNAELVEDAALRATDLTVRVWGARPFAGAEPFTIVGPTYQDRLYGAARILSATADGEATVYGLRIGPPLREAAPAGTLVDFDRPRCVMRPDMTQDSLWPGYGPAFLGQGQLQFSETFS